MNARELIDRTPINAVNITVIAVCFILNMLDGIDVLVVSFTAPAISDEWSLTGEAMGRVFSAGLFGMMLGALFLSSIADRIGRRNMMLVCVLVVGLGTTATGFITTLNQFIAVRVITGLGIGALLASLTSMASEYTPVANRNLGISITVGGYPIGATLGGFIAAWVIPEYGWQTLYFIFGGITALMFPVVLMMPESIQFLVQKQPAGALEKLNRIMVRMNHAPLTELPAADEEHASPGVRPLLTEQRRSQTIKLWIAFCLNFMTLYFLYSWIPKIIVNSGLPLEKGIYTSIALNIGAFVGVIVFGYLSDLKGLSRLILIFLWSAAALMIAFSLSTSMLALLLVITFITGLFLQGGFSGLYSMSARLYPTEIRTTGVGWAIGVGRTGAIIGPYIGGILIDMALPTSVNFTLFAIPLVLAGLAAFTIKPPQY